ncbi:hypothetical protein GCM10010172_12470 [Paractinoplanes ferrugineus]|uniref:Uncharacterized protein n=1 Tax=Paractinoplanes ferrugineus TaxID=113564 RepID=A0A919MJ58_9ACTN|nr:hypothetical protein [Actinoplanes ferrugineus]GIE09812.1 hypothetical protein Afe05nite_16520 [Actinoplanes ferrugineus]
MHDREVVDGTTVQDLDDEAPRRTLRRIRNSAFHTRRWIAGLAAHLPTPAHQIAVPMLREHYLTNEMLRQANWPR